MTQVQTGGQNARHPRRHRPRPIALLEGGGGGMGWGGGRDWAAGLGLGGVGSRDWGGAGGRARAGTGSWDGELGWGWRHGWAHLHRGDDEAPVHDELAERCRALVAAAPVHHEQTADVLEPRDREVSCQRGLPPLLQGRVGCSGRAEPTGERHAAGDGPAGPTAVGASNPQLPGAQSGRNCAGPLPKGAHSRLRSGHCPQDLGRVQLQHCGRPRI